LNNSQNPNLYTERAPLTEPPGPTEKENEQEREQTPSTKKASEQESKHNNDINDTRRHSAAGGRASNLSTQQYRGLRNQQSLTASPPDIQPLPDLGLTFLELQRQ
jgi:hypothetical protein